MIIFSILTIVCLIIIISYAIGSFFAKMLKLDNSLPLTLLGYLLWLSILFISTQFVNINRISSDDLFYLFSIITILLFIASIRSIEFRVSYFEICIIVVYVIILVLLSTRYTLGEQLGDSTYLFTLVNKNINTPIMNNFDFGNGYVFDYSTVFVSRESLTFYHLNSFILSIFYKVKNVVIVDYVPSYVLNMWVNNILFYFFTATIILSIIKILKMRFWTIFLVFVFSGFYIGSYYFNLTLPHFGVTFLGLAISINLLIIWKYLNLREANYIFVLFMLIFSTCSFASTGLIVSVYIVFGFVAILIHMKDQNSLLYASILLLPLIVFANQVSDLIKIPYAIFALSILSIFLLAAHYVIWMKSFIFKNYIALFIVLWILIIILSFLIIPNYLIELRKFSDAKENYDRIRDYFSFTSNIQVIRNLIHYIIIINVLINKKTRDFGLIFLIIVIFFINPLTYPLIYKHIEWLFHRSYFVLFNITSISIGIYALISNISRLKFPIRIFLKVILTIIMLVLTYINIATYENVLYIPREGFNSLYKMTNNQVNVLYKLQEVVSTSEHKNPKVISQIYGTLMFVPDIYQHNFTVSDRRSWDPIKSNEFDELYKMMYTPVFPGDDGPRLEMNYWRLCHVLEQSPVDYLIFDNTLTFLEPDSEEWLPINWFARGCAVNIYENEGYTLYKYTGNTGASE